MRAAATKSILLGAVLIAALVSTGCGGSEGSSGTPKPTGSDGPPGILSKGDCDRLSEFLTVKLGKRVEEIRQSSEPGFPSSCEFQVEQAFVGVSLDPTRPIRRGYLEQVDGNAEPVTGVGESTKGEAGAYWSAGVNHLYIYRQSGWFNVYFPVAMPDREARSSSIRLARRALALTAE